MDGLTNKRTLRLIGLLSQPKIGVFPKMLIIGIKTSKIVGEMAEKNKLDVGKAPLKLVQI